MTPTETWPVTHIFVVPGQYVNFVDLHEWVCDLDAFNDDRDRGGEKVLEAIQAAWIEEIAD